MKKTVTLVVLFLAVLIGGGNKFWKNGNIVDMEEPNYDASAYSLSVYPFLANNSAAWTNNGTSWHQRELLGYQTNTTQYTAAIPTNIVEIGVQYRNTMTNYLGEGAETNTTYSQSYVMMWFLLQTNKTVQMSVDAQVLNASFEIMRATGLSGDNNQVWTFPYGCSVKTTTVEVITPIWGE